MVVELSRLSTGTKSVLTSNGDCVVLAITNES